MSFEIMFFVFILGSLVGFEIITKVPPTLHTPLMSGSNAISGITIVGAIATFGLIALMQESSTLGVVLALIALAFASVNVIGGFMVTDRMLAMFGKKKKKQQS